MKKYPCVYMRGGTSKGVIFNRADLPQDRSTWAELFLKVMGSPDKKQIDGLGGAVVITSKLAVVSKSERTGIDAEFEFFQISPNSDVVDNAANCGNISSAIGPYIIDEGFVEAIEPITVVRILNINTNKVIESHVRVKDGRAMDEGDTVIAGVPGTGSRIDMFFESPGGSVTGKLFPTEHKTDDILLENGDLLTVTIMDCSNPFVFIPAQSMGLRGIELDEIDSDVNLLEKLEEIRGKVAMQLNLVSRWEEARIHSSTIPKIVIVSEPQDYYVGNKAISASDIDLTCRGIASSGKLHNSFPITSYVGTGAAAKIKGTVVYDVARKSDSNEVNIGHAGGFGTVEVHVQGEEVLKGGVVRTARRLMDGFVYIKTEK